jgi:predicted Zn-dependent protease
MRTKLRSRATVLEDLDLVLDRMPVGIDADVRLSEQEAGTMRFANGAVHQPHLERERSVSVRVSHDGRLGTATTTDLSPTGIRAVIRHASDLAHLAPREKQFPGFPSGSERVKPVAFSRTTATLSPEAQMRLATEAIGAATAGAPDSQVAGAVNTGYSSLAVGNTQGLRRFTRRSFVQGSVLVERSEMDPPVSGWSEGASWDVHRFDARRLGREAAERMPRVPPRSVGSGTHRVLLDGPAVSEIIGDIAHLGFGGHGEVEGWSCLKKDRGRRLFPTALTVIDNARSALGIPEGIDHEGLPTRRHSLIAQGVVGRPVLDLVSAGRLHQRPTGHGPPPESPWGDWGPNPEHVEMAPGSERWADLVKEVRKGILVTRFFYVRPVHPAKGIITGMTRDGTYLIEKGEITAPVRNLRFTESVVTALRGAETWGRERRTYSDERGGSSVHCPAMVVGRFRFTSATLF